VNFTVLPEAELEAAEAAIWYDDRYPEDVAVVAISHARRRPLYWLERLD
jgi:hypothetical protein